MTDDEPGSHVYYRDDDIAIVDDQLNILADGSDLWIPLAQLSNYTFVDAARKRRQLGTATAAGLVPVAMGAAVTWAGGWAALSTTLFGLGGSMVVFGLWELFRCRRERRWTMRADFWQGVLTLYETDDSQAFGRFVRGLQRARGII
ncbi:DUF6232 family protein [Actinoplanes couchii]|uniref:DUF6232 family protein n=1 Tax=Actinoplanes couchii TaxID=403638 RepID=UPI001942442E|nr:DUF6232 family protein [Actinoplanes couchii]MDR6320344.1 hypothetical protein [Actinoplanes couchii]